MKNQHSIIKYVILFAGLTILLLGLFVLSVCIGSVHITPQNLVGAFTAFSNDADQINIISNDQMVINRIIFDIRLPRAIAAIFIGGALSVAGFLLQTFFRNPIAGPYVLGISSGAKLVVAIGMIFFLGRGFVMNSFFMIVFAFAGAMISMLLVLMVSRSVNNMSVLIICGVMIGYICSAITDFLVTFADDSNIVNLHSWSLGSFAGTSLNQVKLLSVIISIIVVLAFFISKPMSAYQLGDSYALTLGVNVKKLRIALILLSSILAACVTAFAGPISFVGVAVPHLIKSIFKSAKPQLLIPGCFLGGAIFCLVSDLIARMAFAPTELSISSVTAIFGAPVVVYLMLKQTRNRYEG